MSAKVKIEGYWYSEATPEYPMPVHTDVVPHNKSDILKALDKAEASARTVAYKGFSICRCCGRINGSREFSYKGWSWPEGFRHYIEDHNIVPSFKFTEEVLELDARGVQVTEWTRNVTDEFKSKSNEEIKAVLDSRRFPMAAAFENWIGDFNMSSGFRNANGFNLNEIFYIGRKKWDRRGAVGCHNYMNITHCDDFNTFKEKAKDYTLIGIDNIEGAVSIEDFEWPDNPLVVFGEEGPGMTREAQEACKTLVYIPMFGSVRSFNCAVASGIIMYDYVSKLRKRHA